MARCSALFTEATVVSKAAAVSAADQSRTSRRTSTARRLGGKSWITARYAGIKATNVLATPTPEKLRHLAEMIQSGLTMPIQATYPLDDVTQAMATFQAGTTGKIILEF